MTKPIYTIKVNGQDWQMFYTDRMLAERKVSFLKRRFPNANFKVVITGTLAKRLKPYKASKLEAEGKLQIEAALKDKGLNSFEDKLDDNFVFGEEDPMDLAKDEFIDKHQRGY